MSALLTPDDDAISKGVAGAFVKPFDLDELIETLHDAVPPRREAPRAGAPAAPRHAACRPADPARPATPVSALTNAAPPSRRY